MGFFGRLFGKKSDENVGEPAANSWKVGERVLASWLDTFFYPGRVRQIQGNNCEVVFDDGESAWVHAANVRRPDIKLGSKVFCRFHAGPMFLPGTVNQQNGEKILVVYENGEKEWTTISMVRVQRPLANVGESPAVPHQGQPGAAPMFPGLPGGMMPGGMGKGGPMIGTMTAAGPMMLPPGGPFIPDVGDPVNDSDWRVGDRVLGRWFDFFWYPATILAIGTKGLPPALRRRRSARRARPLAHADRSRGGRGDIHSAQGSAAAHLLAGPHRRGARRNHRRVDLEDGTAGDQPEPEPGAVLVLSRGRACRRLRGNRSRLGPGHRRLHLSRPRSCPSTATRSSSISSTARNAC